MSAARWIVAVGILPVVVTGGACVLPPRSAGEGHTEGSTTIMDATSTDASASGAGQTVSPDGTSVEVPPSSGGDAGPTCRDAIACRFGCVVEMAPELEGCQAACEEGMAVEQVQLLLQLTECVTNTCIERGPCDVVGASSTGEPGTGTSETGGSSASGSEGGDIVDPCSNCVLGSLHDPMPPGCESLAELCM